MHSSPINHSINEITCPAPATTQVTGDDKMTGAVPEQVLCSRDVLATPVGEDAACQQIIRVSNNGTACLVCWACSGAVASGVWVLKHPRNKF